MTLGGHWRPLPLDVWRRPSSCPHVTWFRTTARPEIKEVFVLNKVAQNVMNWPLCEDCCPRLVLHSPGCACRKRRGRSRMETLHIALLCHCNRRRIESVVSMAHRRRPCRFAISCRRRWVSLPLAPSMTMTSQILFRSRDRRATWICLRRDYSGLLPQSHTMPTRWPDAKCFIRGCNFSEISANLEISGIRLRSEKTLKVRERSGNSG